MTLDPWYKNFTLRKEVREGPSVDPDEFNVNPPCYWPYGGTV